MEVGDVVFMYYPSSIKDDYRLARVIETCPDKKGLVRSVKVCYRKRDKREKVSEYRAKPLTEEIVAVQRLSLLLPASDQSLSTKPDASSPLPAPAQPPPLLSSSLSRSPTSSPSDFQ